MLVPRRVGIGLSCLSLLDILFVESLLLHLLRISEVAVRKTKHVFFFRLTPSTKGNLALQCFTVEASE